MLKLLAIYKKNKIMDAHARMKELDDQFENNYGIYQFFARNNKERRLLIGFIRSESERDAINDFTQDEFRRGFLSAVKCSERDYQRPDLLEAIEKHKKELGIWV
jgi:hypothetical protein